MDIVIIAQYMRNIETDSNNSRFLYLAKMLTEKKNKHTVEIITSDFLHGQKRHIKSIYGYDGITITALHEPGYKKNVSLKRFQSHAVLAKNIKSYLHKRKTPDVIYCAVPSLSVAQAAAEYCKQNNVRFIIDIQDLWPEAFEMVFKVPVLSDIIFAPLRKQADRIYAEADNIIAVSETYKERALRKNTKCKTPAVVYLGTEKNSFDKYACADKAISAQIPKISDKSIIHIGYAGSLAASYDLPVVFDAMRKLPENDLKRIQLVVMGDGARRQQFEDNAAGLPVIFTGRLQYGDMVWNLVRCDITINPIVHGSAASIINKHNDYAMAGLPVINTQESEEYRDLIDAYNCGINCGCGDAESVCSALKILINDEMLRKEMGKNHRRMAEELFDRRETYKKIVGVIENSH